MEGDPRFLADLVAKKGISGVFHVPLIASSTAPTHSPEKKKDSIKSIEEKFVVLTPKNHNPMVMVIYVFGSWVPCKKRIQIKHDHKITK